MEIKDAKCRWTKFLFERSPVYTINEILKTEIPDGKTNNCNVFVEGVVYVIIHDSIKSLVSISIAKHDGFYYIGHDCEDLTGSGLGSSCLPSIFNGVTKFKDKKSGIVDCLKGMKRYFDKCDVFDVIKEDTKKALDFFEGKSETEPIQFEINFDYE